MTERMQAAPGSQPSICFSIEVSAPAWCVNSPKIDPHAERKRSRRGSRFPTLLAGSPPGTLAQAVEGLIELIS